MPRFRRLVPVKVGLENREIPFPNKPHALSFLYPKGHSFGPVRGATGMRARPRRWTMIDMNIQSMACATLSHHRECI